MAVRSDDANRHAKKSRESPACAVATNDEVLQVLAQLCEALFELALEGTEIR